ncbi:terminase large subunit domain-containing protein [Enterovibrio calviensis]|uniref:terminase large subunit domain-containing protein n=1 Tax=Enterovibrio calviensis TaxID=91359 RepID=UPI000AE381A0|nr:terminase family protein [Enterovibrio calviensis]
MELEELLSLLGKIEESQKFNKWLNFKPYDFQLTMFGAGVKHRSRYACLANRIGKTYAGSLEVAYHLTGKYPEWWNGIKYDYPVLVWAIGLTANSTRTVMQKEVLGTEIGKDLSNVGSGSIPRDFIDFASLERDGNTIQTVRVKHYTNGIQDGLSTLEFRSTQQGVMSLMGQSVDFIWLDEEDHYKSLEIFAQCLTRTGTKAKGRILQTATPEAGYTELIRKFEEEQGLFIFHAGWDDAPHLTETIKSELLAGIPEWEIPMRTKGLPSRGSGAIFPVDDDFISVPDFEPQEHWPVIAGVDFGKSVDPSVVMFITKDPETETYFIFKEFFLNVDKSVDAIANAIKTSQYPRIPVIVPHDANTAVEGGGMETKARLLRGLNCNVIRRVFNNPQFIQNKITNCQEKNQGREGGLHWMAYGLKSGFIKVAADCMHWRRQKRSFFWKQRGGKTISASTHDDTIDASRYALLTIDRYGIPAAQTRIDFDDWNDGFTTSDSGYDVY